MAVTQDKARAYGALIGLLACACASTDTDARVVTSSTAEPFHLHRPEEIERFLSCDAQSSALEAAQLPLRRRSLRLVVSDFLFPHDADALVGRLAREGAWLALIQLTLREEAEPPIDGGRRLIDAEGHGELDLVIDDEATRAYRARFGRLRSGLSIAARRAGARFAYVSAGRPVREVARGLAAAGVLEPT